MATSGSINFTVTRDDIITEALETLGALEEGDSPSADQLTSMSRKLNMLVKAWQADGLNLFAVQRLYLIPQVGQHEYSIGASSTDHCTTSLVKTTLSVAASETDTTITVTAVTGISDTYNIGVELDDGTIQWTTVSGAPAGSVVTLADALTDDAASGNVVYVYSVVAGRPMKILDVALRDSSNRDTPIFPLTRQGYVSLSDKTQDGTINQYYYDPQITLGKFFIWPEQSDCSSHLVLWVQRTLEDFDAATDDADFPQEWYLPLAYNLALLSTPTYGTTQMEYKKILGLAQAYYDMASSFDTEDSIKIEPAGE